MSAPERRFLIGTLIATILVPGALALGQPLAEENQLFGYLCGWGLALLVIVPSTFLMLRVKEADTNRFFGVFLGATAGRFLVVILAIVAFYLFVEPRPLYAFLISFFLGYFILTALELIQVTRRGPDRSHA